MEDNNAEGYFFFSDFETNSDDANGLREVEEGNQQELEVDNDARTSKIGPENIPLFQARLHQVILLLMMATSFLLK